jgi:hypothetical protein
MANMNQNYTFRECVSELQTLMSPLFNPQMIYEYEEPRWNDIDRGKAKNSDRNLSQCHCVNTNPIWTDPTQTRPPRSPR